MDLFWVLVLSTIQLLRCGILEMQTRIIDSLPVGVKCMSFPQIHRLSPNPPKEGVGSVS